MKILQLNIWMGKVEGNLRRFLAKSDFDLICMQEVLASPDREIHLSRLCFDLSQIQKFANLPYAFFSPNWSYDLAGGSCALGNLILSRIPFTHTSSEFINGEYREHTILGESPANNLNLQIARLETGLNIVNHHGFWRPDPIGDEETVAALKKVGQIVSKIDGPLVMCGDLNVIHDAPAMRSLDFLHDLTYENNINNTLSGLKFDGMVACDHILVNDRIEVKSFDVLPDLVSDHLALTADIEIKS